MQFIIQLQTHCLSKMVTAIIVLTHLNYDISHYCGDYCASINHKGLIFLTGLLARESRQDITPCPAILHSSCQSVLMAVLCLLLRHQHGTCPSHLQTRTLLWQWAPRGWAQKPLEVLSWMLPKWPDAEPRPGFPIGTGKLLAVPLWPPVLLF